MVPDTDPGIGYLVSATHFMEIIRIMILLGAPLVDLLPEVLMLIFMGLVLLLLNPLRFESNWLE